MAPTVEEIVKHLEIDPSEVEYVSRRSTMRKLEIHEPDPSWPQTFATLKALIVDALGPTALTVVHTGSTSVPGLIAKGIIDIDITVPDPTNESTYAAALEAAGFIFRLREPTWYQHRFFFRDEPAANLHVFGPDAPEPVRHRIFCEWLRAHPDDMKLYADTKKRAMGESNRAGESLAQYTERKSAVIHEILQRAFRSLGYIE